MTREPWAKALTATLALSVCHATAGGLAYESELEDAFLKWFPRPGMLLSVFNNAGDLKACGERVGANASYVISRPPLAFDDGATDGFHVDASMDNLRPFLDFTDKHGFQVDVSLGEHNNPFFMYYPPEFVERHPESFMRDQGGNLIRVTSNPIHDAQSLVPAVCDPVLQRMVSRYLRGGIPVIAGYDSIHSWIIKGEESWPDYFGLPMGDFREQSLEQFQAWLGLHRPGMVLDPKDLSPDEDGPGSAAWFMYREQAMVDRAAWYLRDHLASDPKGRPVLYATHGNPFSDRHRRGLGLAPGLLAGTCDGFEMGHIAIDDDTESLNLLYMNMLGAYGLPVTVPRLGNKTLDPEARGGGRTFTPRMLRRMVYECVGMGVPHIGPITWDVSLGDGEWFIKDTPAEAACREVFAEICETAPFLEGMARVQPRMGLYISDATWRDRWNPRWTAFFQDALHHHDHLSLIGDAMISADLASRMPAITCMDNTVIARAALDGLAQYLNAGGRLVVWGGFAEHDEWGDRLDVDAMRKITEHAGCTVLDHPPGEHERMLVNRFQTGNGAWAREHQFHAAPYEQILGAFGEEASLQPVLMVAREGGDTLTVLPLTEGVSLMAVLINNGPDAVQAAVKPSTGEHWSAFDALSRSPLTSTGEKFWEVEIEGHGTRLVWFAPSASEEAIEESVAEALAALARWDAAGADTGFLAAHRAFLSTAQPDGALGLKAHALARRVVGALCGVVGNEVDPLGRLAVTMRLTDATGAPAERCAVEVRAVPGGHRWVHAEELEPGFYRAACSPESGELYYDVLRGTYRPFTEVRRVTARMRDAERSGGADIMVRTTPDLELLKAIGLGSSGEHH